MALIASDGLSLLIGDGLSSETFNLLSGMSLARVEITQRLNESIAVGNDAWQVNVGTTERKVMMDVEALASDGVAFLRLRSLALTGLTGNFRLETSSSETLRFSAAITQYRESIEAGTIKKLSVRIESSGAATIG